MSDSAKHPIAHRFRGFLPVVIDIETGGFNPKTDAMLEIAAAILQLDNDGIMSIRSTHAYHVEPFEGSNIEPASLQVTGINPHSPFRQALPEEEALKFILREVRRAVKETGCNRAVMVAHNAWFDLSFFNAAVERCDIKRNPFHPFSCFDTATLGGLLYGQTVLQRIATAAGLPWDESSAHSAAYDTEQTAKLFCQMVNQSRDLFENNLASIR